jgi:hypothetical protein
MILSHLLTCFCRLKCPNFRRASTAAHHQLRRMIILSALYANSLPVEWGLYEEAPMSRTALLLDTVSTESVHCGAGSQDDSQAIIGVNPSELVAAWLCCSFPIKKEDWKCWPLFTVGLAFHLTLGGRSLTLEYILIA